MPLPREIAVAAQRGELQQVVKWLQKGGQVDALDALDESRGGLLHAAAVGGRLRVAKELLQRGASIDLRSAKGSTALMVAAVMGQTAVVRMLLEHKASIDLQNMCGSTALMHAAIKGKKECVQELLAAGASTEFCDQNGATALQIAKGHAAVAELLQQHASKPPACMFEIAGAAKRGELQPVIKWLQAGGHADMLAENGAGLLHAAATGGRLRVAKELLQRGASVDLRGGASVDLRGSKDVTALMMAAMMGEHAMVRLLLEHKAGVDLQNVDGGTALMVH